MERTANKRPLTVPPLSRDEPQQNGDAEAVRALLDVPGATLLILPRLLIDESFRARLIELDVDDPVVRSFSSLANASSYRA